MSIAEQVNILYQKQCSEWGLLATNTQALEHVRTRSIYFNDFAIKIQCNPARIRSSAAKVDSASIQKRACFLCETNRPSQQASLPFLSDYSILCNPFPIFRKHLTIVSKQHTPQLISDRLSDMLTLCKALPEHDVFYNGPECGASAPDHFHFQAIPKKSIPLFTDLKNAKLVCKLYQAKEITIFQSTNYLRKVYLLCSPNEEQLILAFKQLYHQIHLIQSALIEPMMNVIARHNDNGYSLAIFPRIKHRPSCFYETGEKHLLISPASIDFSGVLILPHEEDFNRITASDIQCIFEELTWNGSIEFSLNRCL